MTGVLGMKGADNERENKVVVLVCCRCALTPNKLSSVACNLRLVFSRSPLGSDRL